MSEIKLVHGVGVNDADYVVTRQEFLDIQQRIDELENKLWAIENGDHYIYPKGEILNAEPFVIDDSFPQEFTAYSEDFPMFVEIKKD